jgi:transcriptional regulator with XRE-family HTH domain
MAGQHKSPGELQIEIGESIRRRRIDCVLTQADLAAKAGLSLRAVAALERGEGSSLETFVRALGALGATDVLQSIAPAVTISPLAMLRNGEGERRRIRRSTVSP